MERRLFLLSAKISVNGAELLFDIGCLEANFGSPEMDVYDSLDVGRQGDLAHYTGWGGGCHCWRKRLHQHMESSLHLPTMSNTGTQCVPLPHHPLVPPPTSGLPLLQSLVRRPPASYHSQRCSRATHPPAVRQL